MKKYLYKLILAIFMLYPVTGLSDAVIGLIVASRGEAVNETGERLSQGQYVFEHNTIVTGDKSFIVIQMTDGTKLTIRPNSSLKIINYSYDGETEDDQMKLSLVSGGLRIISGSIAKNNPENYVLQTPVALMGVRGTEFSVQLCGQQVCQSE